ARQRLTRIRFERDGLQPVRYRSEIDWALAPEGMTVRALRLNAPHLVLRDVGSSTPERMSSSPAHPFTLACVSALELRHNRGSRYGSISLRQRPLHCHPHDR